MSTKSWQIAGKTIGEKPYIIAEIGLNHNGKEKLAAQMIEAAAAAGADAVKFQLFKAEELVSAPADKNAFDAVSFFRQFELSPQSYQRLFKLCQKNKITFLATPFDSDNVNLLASLGVDAFKIASGDLTYFPLLHQAAALGKPMLVSTGMANLDEVAAAVQLIKETGNEQVLLFHCTSAYPCPSTEVNLNNLITLANTFDLPVGLSDHTEGILAALAAVLLGAVMIEKHFTLDRNLPGPDQKLSMEPKELKTLIEDLAQISLMRGSYDKLPTASEKNTRILARRSIFARIDIPGGVEITPQMLAYRRPGTGISPTQAEEIIGRTTRQAIKKDEMLTWDSL